MSNTESALFIKRAWCSWRGFENCREEPDLRTGSWEGVGVRRADPGPVSPVGTELKGGVGYSEKGAGLEKSFL